MIKSYFSEHELSILEEKYTKSAQSILQVKSGVVFELKNKIFEYTDFLPKNIKLKVRLWHILNDVDSLPTCETCGESYSTINENNRISSQPNEFPYSTHCNDNKRVWNTKIFIEESKKVSLSNLDYSILTYNGMQSNIRVRCIDHDLVFEQNAQNHLNSKYPCPECKKEYLSNSYRFSIDLWVERFKSIHGGIYDYSNITSIKNAKDRIIVSCNDHGEWETDCFNHYNDSLGCPKCFLEKELTYDYRSKEEIELYDYIVSVLPSHIEVQFSNRSCLNGKEIDIYIPKLNMGIEYNGLYWHSSIHKQPSYHLNKTKLAKKKGVKLIHIFSDEWINKREIVKTKLSHIFNLNYQDKIYARKTKCVVSSNKEVELFYDDNHIQGSMKTASVVLTLTHGSDIVASMSFKILSYGEWDLVRYATSCNVVGGFTKLLSFFKKNYVWDKIVTFADLRWSDGRLYIDSGFNEVHRTKPNYFYIKDGIRYNKRKFRHKHLKDILPNYNSDLSEFENTENHGIHRIYDCGLIKFEQIKKGI